MYICGGHSSHDFEHFLGDYLRFYWKPNFPLGRVRVRVRVRVMECYKFFYFYVFWHKVEYGTNTH